MKIDISAGQSGRCFLKKNGQNLDADEQNGE
jgi:hypothetical protein